MNDEIKEINIPENVLVALGDLTNGALNYYKATETVKVRYNTILDYITNLQDKEKLEEIFKKYYEDEVEKNKRLQDRNIELVLERDRLKELCDKYEEEHKTTFEYWKRLVKENYKSRNEKAIEYNYELQERYCHSALYDDLVASKIYEISEKNIKLLNGGDDNE